MWLYRDCEAMHVTLANFGQSTNKTLQLMFRASGTKGIVFSHWRV